MSFNPQHISKLLQEVPEEMEWLWGRMLPTGTSDVLAAYMKVGKSTLAYDLVRASSLNNESAGPQDPTRY